MAILEDMRGGGYKGTLGVNTGMRGLTEMLDFAHDFRKGSY